MHADSLGGEWASNILVRRLVILGHNHPSGVSEPSEADRHHAEAREGARARRDPAPRPRRGQPRRTRVPRRARMALGAASSATLPSPAPNRY